MRILVTNTKAYLKETLELQRCHLYIDTCGQLTVLSAEGEQLTDEQRGADAVIDGRNLVAMPAFSDLHVHFREPGFEHKETLLGGQRSAIKGGVTQVCTMPNTKPPIDRVERLADYQRRIGPKPHIEILPSVAITLEQSGEAITDLAAMSELGAAAYTDDGRTVMSPDILREALKISKLTCKPVMTHSEDHEEAARYPEGPYPPEVESRIVSRDIQILSECGGKLHIAHLSTEGALEAVRKGKALGLDLSCEVSPHHLYFDADQLSFETAKYKVNPPLRGEANRQALIQGIRDGVVDAIASDHAPHELESKLTGYKQGAYGFIGLETMYAAVNTVFKASDIPTEVLIRLMSINPRKLMGTAPNYIETGARADFVLVDPEQKWTVTAIDLAGTSQNSPWLGHTLTGRVVHLIKENQWLLKGGEIHVV